MSETKECCYLCVLKFLLPLGFLALLPWLCIIPKPPRYTIVDFTIPKCNLDIDGGKKGSMVYGLEIKNSNERSSILYDDILLTFYYGQDKVGENTMPAFHQGRRRTFRVVDRVEVVNQHLWNAICVSILNGTAELKVALLTRIQYGVSIMGYTCKLHYQSGQIARFLDKVAEKTIPPFHQGRGKTRSEIENMDVNPQVWRAVRNSILNATAELKVTLLTKIRYKTWGIRSKHHGLDLQGALPIGKDGKLSGKKKKIKLSHASKKLKRNSLRLLS